MQYYHNKVLPQYFEVLIRLDPNLPPSAQRILLPRLQNAGLVLLFKLRTPQYNVWTMREVRYLCTSDPPLTAARIVRTKTTIIILLSLFRR